MEYCYNQHDVKKSISWARENSLPIRVRSGGHHYEGYSTGNDVVIIDVSRMNSIYIDEKKVQLEYKVELEIENYMRL